MSIQPELSRPWRQWVVGGKLTFLPGAIVEGSEGLLDLPSGKQAQLPNIPPSDATTVAALQEVFNSLIAALKASGLMASVAQEKTGSDENRSD